MGKPLTAELVLLRSKCDNLLTVKNLNLWGNEIDDVKLLRQMPNVEVLSLSLNKISSLKEFASCSKLQELYLRRNSITDISEVRYLSHLQNLKILWLLDNPCSEIENYREIVIKLLPNLVKLDNTHITGEERSNAANKVFNFMEDENNDSESKVKQNLPLSEKRSPTNEYNCEKNNLNHLNQQPSTHVVMKKESVQKKEYDSQINDNLVYFENPAPRVSNKKNENILAGINKKEHDMGEFLQGYHENAIKQNSNNTINKNENILCAVLALLKELDETSLELVRREIERKISKMC